MLSKLSVVSLLPLLPLATSLDWTTYTSNGVNLGGWLCQESTIDTTWWAAHSSGAPDEWGLCANLGSQCAPVLERRYATYITPSDIDTLASAGINTLRIPTTYAAWIHLPGSQLHSGNQVSFLDNIASYAINKYGMHIIIDIHSLPGGVNGMPFGEAEGHFGWFQNETALSYSLQAVDAVLDYIQNSAHPGSYTLAPVNEPVDNTDFSTFGSPAALTDDGAAWVLRYILAVIEKVEAVNPSIPIMFQGSFRSEEFWAPQLPSDANVVFDVHHYYFAGRGATGATITDFICQDAVGGQGDGAFPVFVGEWSVQAETANKLDERAKALNTGLKAWKDYARGSAFWTAKFSGNASVDGEGTQADYWDYMTWIEGDMIDPSLAVAC